MEELIKAYLVNQSEWFADEEILSIDSNVQYDEQCYTVIFCGFTKSEHITNSELLTFLYERTL